MRRKYKSRMLQRLYDHMRDNPPIKNGRRHRGASHRAAFWNGVDSLKRNGCFPYPRNSQNHACYMAGLDSRNDPEVKAAKRVNIAAGITG